MFCKKTIKYLLFFSLSLLFLFLLLPPRSLFSNNEEVKVDFVFADDSAQGKKIKNIMESINKERGKYNLPLLSYSPELARLAEMRIIDMRHQGYFSHYNPQGEDLEYFSQKINYDYLILGENLTIEYDDSHEIVEAWLASKSHRENMLRSDYKDMGVSYGLAKVNNKESLITVLILGLEQKNKLVLK